MVFCKLLVSPMPHARVRSIDTSAAEALPGVEGILTADDLPDVAAPNEAALTMEPRYEGEPILAVAAVDEGTAAEAIELIDIELEPLEFVLDPLDSLRPGGPNARTDGNTMLGRELGEIKWTEPDVAGLAPGEIPMGAPAGAEWEYGDLASGFAEADVVVEEHSYHQSLSHQPLESRTTLAYWEGRKLYVYPSVQSTARSVGPMARWAGIEPSDVGCHRRSGSTTTVHRASSTYRTSSRRIRGAEPSHERSLGMAQWPRVDQSSAERHVTVRMLIRAPIGLPL